MTTFGIEEEFMLVDRRTLLPVGRASEAIDGLSSHASGAEFKAEFLDSQIEHATAVCSDLEAARRAVLGARRAVRDWARANDLLVIGSGTPFALPERVSTASAERYHRIADDVGMLTEEHLLNGMHVHVGVPDEDTAVAVANGMRAWLPLLLALSSNSPFWGGRDTGHQSWRAVQTRRWTTYGVPPHFRDHADYADTIARLLGIGATAEYASNGWAVRPSARFPTVEIRISDTQLDADATLALASVVRALAQAALGAASPQAPTRSHVLDAELWHAGRHGVADGVFDATTGAHVAAADAISALRRVIAPFVAEDGADDCVDQYFARIGSDGTGADRQRRALARGRESLTALHDRAFAS